jgi:hypothetical protein
VIETKRNQLSLQSSLFKQERRGVIAKVLSPIAWLANKLYAIEEKSKEVANVYRHGLTFLLSSTMSTVQTRVQCNDNSTRSYENQSVHRAVSKLVKTAINTAITVKLLKSKVTLLNTCEKLKMTHETEFG